MVNRGTLPPQLLLEVLHSVQHVLFPNDARSTKSLGNFIRRYDFDPKATVYDDDIRTLPDEFEYKYFGSRLATLSNFVDQPANSLASWFVKWIKGGTPVVIAIVGLYLTVLIGTLSMCIHGSSLHMNAYGGS